MARWNVAPLPTPEELSSLPARALLAYAARCARRLQALSGAERVVDRSISVAEQVAAGGSLSADHREMASVVARARAEHGRTKPNTVGRITADRELRLALLTGALLSQDPAQVVYECAQACDAYVGQSWINRMVLHLDREDEGFQDDPACETAARVASHALSRDCILLRDASRSESWDNETPVPSSFFALRSEFDIPDRGSHPSFVEISEMLKVEFADYFLRHPERLPSVSPREFEEIVASLLKGFGFEVELTARTRDGGRDVVATSADPVGIKLLIECKRYRRDRTVGISIVKELHGVVEDERATKGILVTTGKLSRTAREHIERNQWQLEARDLDGLVEWLTHYQKAQIERISRLIRQAGGAA